MSYANSAFEGLPPNTAGTAGPAMCSVVASNNYDTCGSLTKSNLAQLTAAQVRALFTAGSGIWYENKSYLKTQFEMAACGIKRYGLYDWIMSSNRPGLGKLINQVNRDKGPSLIQPFIMARQKSVINTDFWYIISGADKDDYTPATATPLGNAGPLTVAQIALHETDADRVIRVSSVYGGTSFDLSAAWFLEKQYIYILGASGGASTHGAWRVLAAAAGTPASGIPCVDVLITSQNTYSTTAVDATPTSGVVLIGINNVNDYEKFCANPANINPWKHVPFWYQTRRRTRCVDSTYRELFAKLMADNEYFAEFGDLPLAERNRQDEAEWQKQFINSFFFGRPISSNQTLSLWGSLDDINAYNGTTTGVNPETGGQLQAVRANMIGVYEIMKTCADSGGFSRVRDLQNQALNIQELFDELVNIYRARKSSGKANPQLIDSYCGLVVSELLEIGIINWFKEKYGDIIRVNITPGSNEFGFTWKTFDLPFYGIKFNVITEETFDDLETAFTTAGVTRGGFLMILDLGKGGTIYPAILGSNRKVYTVGDINNLAKLDSSYSCVMEAPTAEKTLTSETVTAIVECPSNSLWIEGIATDAAMIYSGRVSAYGNLYGGSNA